MGPDEYHDRYPGAGEPGLRNNAYTNVMAAWVLQRALELFEILPETPLRDAGERIGLEEEEKALWAEMSKSLRVPFHGDGLISQFEGYEHLDELDWDAYRERYGDIQRLDRILEAEGDTPNRYKASKQADVLMLFYLFSSEELGALFESLGYPFPQETIPKNIDYYARRTSNGSTLSRVVHSWVLARSRRERSWDLFLEALKSDVSDIQGGTTPEGIHLGAMAGTIDLVQRAYTGLETRKGALRFNPALPESLETVRFRLLYRGTPLEVEIRRDAMKVRAVSKRARPVKVAVGVETFEIAGGETHEWRIEKRES
jgi:alpha,alpha-trehalase